MSWINVAVIGGSAALGYLGSKKAAGAQADAAARAGDIQMAQYQQSREDLSPWRTGGVEANQRLMEYLGIDTGDGSIMPTREQFTSAPQSSGGKKSRFGKLSKALTVLRGPRSGLESKIFGGLQGSSAPGGFDEAGYNAAMANYVARQEEMNRARGDPTYGSLLRPFTGEDLTSEPGYQFGLAEGEKGIDRAALARGGYDSGATLKALTRFNQDYGGTKYSEAYNRDAANKARIYGYLSGVSGTGVNAAGQTAGLGAGAAGAAGGYLTNAGDARAAGIVGGVNAITSGAGSYLGYRQDQQVLDYLKNLRQPISSSSPGFNWGSSGYTGSIYTGGY